MANRYKVVYGISNGAIPNDLKRTLTLFSRSHHSMTLNISQTATDTVLANITRSPANAGRPRDAVFTYRGPHFRFPWRRPCDYVAKCCMGGNISQCLPNPSQHVSIYLQQFPSYTTLNSIRRSKNRHFYHNFVSSGDAPGANTLNVARIE